uniref:MYND-type domain-containing protein n=1 Tax=Psilocybe cubensis TaxID=181762 RepID=A0A8H7XJV3_PSICU
MSEVVASDSEDKVKVIKSEVKEAKRRAEMSCGRMDCMQFDNEKNPTFKRCGKCVVKYCSRHCQKMDWPRHKENYTTLPEEGRRFATIVKYLASNPYLAMNFQIMTVFLFKLHLMNESELINFQDKPFAVGIFLQQEPANIVDFFRLYRRASIYDTKGPILGMPKIANVVVEKDFSVRDTLIWRDELEEAKSSTSWIIITPPIKCPLSPLEGDLPIHNSDKPIAGYLRFKFRMPTVGHCFRMGIVSQCITISGTAIRRAKEMVPLIIETHINRITFETIRNLSFDTLIEKINSDIRRDSLDLLRLRTELQEYERGVLALGAPPYDDSWLNVVFTRVTREKIRREVVYSIGAHYCGREIEGISKMTYQDWKTGVVGGLEMLDLWKAQVSEMQLTPDTDRHISKKKKKKKKKRQKPLQGSS